MSLRISVLTRFGSTVRKYRLKLGLSQEEFAFVVGLHRTYVGAIERGERNITLNKMVQIANALKVRPSDLCQELD